MNYKQLLENILSEEREFDRYKDAYHEFLNKVKTVFNRKLMPNHKFYEDNVSEIIFSWSKSVTSHSHYLVYDKKTETWTGRVNTYKIKLKTPSKTEVKLFNGKKMPFDKIKNVEKFINEWVSAVDELIAYPEPDTSNPMLKSRNPLGGNGASHWS